MTQSPTTELDSAGRIDELRHKISSKGALKAFYEDAYLRFGDCLSRCPPQGVTLELGSGGGFIKERIPEVTTSDILEYDGVDRVLDACKLDFPNGSLRAIFMLNVFHHIPDVRAFLTEAHRCLAKGGRILIVDHYLGWPSRLILKYFHHEAFEPGSSEWAFQTTGPLSGANTALAHIVFLRDREKFLREFQGFSIAKHVPHSPLYYWLSGGLKSWTLIPSSKKAIAVARMFDSCLLKLSRSTASYVDIELVKN